MQFCEDLEKYIKAYTRPYRYPKKKPQDPGSSSSAVAGSYCHGAYTLAGDSSPVTPLGARPRNPN